MRRLYNKPQITATCTSSYFSSVHIRLLPFHKLARIKQLSASSQRSINIPVLQDPHLNPSSHSSLSMAAQTPRNCHCDTFKFRVLHPEPDSVTEYICSMCFNKNYKWIYPLPENFTIEKGSLVSLSIYTFGKGELMHIVSNPTL